MLCCVTVRSVWRVDRLAVAFRMASLSGALFSCFFCWKRQMRDRQSTTVLFLVKVAQNKQNAFKKLTQPTFSSEPTSTIFGRVGGGLFFMSSKTSTTNMKRWQVMEESVSDCLNLKRCQILILRCIPLSLRFSSATVLVSVRTLSVAACMSLWWVRVLGSSRLPCTY